MKCKICGNDANTAYTMKVMNKYDVKYFSCPACDYLFTEEPFWLEEAYKNPINITDTGLVDRNMHLSKMAAVIIYFFFNREKKFLDYAGGYGLFTRLMRDYGFDFYWYDPYCRNLFASGFEYDINKKDHVELVTAFEVFEHLVNPPDELKKILDISGNIIFSTELLPEKIPSKSWDYYGFEHGQHISFYSKKTLQTLAEINNVNLYTTGNFHIFTKKQLNNAVIKLLLRLANRGLGLVVKKFMKTKMWDDFYLLKNREIKQS